MMLPSLSQPRRQTLTVDTWQGYRADLPPRGGAFSLAENLCADRYPALTARPAQSVAETGVTDVFAKAQLALVRGGWLEYDGKQVCQLSAGKKQMVGLGAYLLVWPDKLMYNTADGTVQSMEARFSGSVTLALCEGDGSACEPTVSDTAPSSPAAGALWLDTSGDEDVLKRWNQNTNSWDSVSTPYVKMSATGIGKSFAVYDSVKISGVSGQNADALNSQPDEDGKVWPDRIIYGRGDDYLIFSALIRQSLSCSGVSVSREAPQLDFVTESDNRVWGCSSERNEIQCCKLGDPTNWYRYMGTADDSYAVSVGSDGAFTGAATHLGYVLFFKEECIHKIYGSVPSKYQVMTTRCRGVQAGCEQGLTLVNETLYYKSRYDVCCYDGSLPQKISAALGQQSFDTAAGGSWGPLYYLSMRNTADGSRSCFVYDTENGVWHCQPGLAVERFARCEGKLYGLDSAGRLHLLRGAAESAESVAWQAVTMPFGAEQLDTKYPEKLQLRAELPAGSRFFVDAEYDGDGVWRPLGGVYGRRESSVRLPLRVRRCDRFRLRFRGQGPFVLHSLTLTTTAGAEGKR